MPRVELDPEYPSEAWQLRNMERTIADIWRWKKAYYNTGATIVDDATYDLWWRNLLFLESKYPHLVRENSPTNAVGIAPD